MSARRVKTAAALCAAFCAFALGACGGYYIVGDEDYSDVVFGDVSVSEASVLADTKEFVYGDRDIEVSAQMNVSTDILDRTAFTAGTDGAPTRGERAAAARLRDMFAAAGFANRDANADAGRVPAAPYTETRSFTRTIKLSTGVFTSTMREVTSQNVVAVIPATDVNLGTVIVGTHYDNRYGSDLIEGEHGHGVYSGGLGVGALVTVAREALKRERPYTLQFVAFGAGEPGNMGSEEFVGRMSAAERQGTLLTFHFDLMGGGDHLYMFCDDAETAHEDYLRAACDRVAPQVRRPPKDKRVILSNGSTETYTHYGFFGDNHSFYRAGIPSAAFFGLNWEADGIYGLVESTTQGAILGTADDTLYEVMRRYPDSLAKTAAAANVVLSVLDADPREFAEVMNDSRKTRLSVEWLTDTRTQMYIYGGAVLLLAIAAGVTAGILSRRKPKPEDLIELPRDDVFRTDGGDEGPFAGY